MVILDRFRRFLREQSKNYYILLIRGIFASFLSRLVMNFTNLYIVALGATPFQLSTVRAIGSAVSALIAIPAGWVCDMYSLKKMLILGMLVQVLSVSFYAFAQDWRWIIVAMILGSLTMALVFRTQNIIIANSLSDHDRATGYGMRTTIIQLFSIVAPTVGGLLVHYFGGLSVEGIRPLYYIQLVGYILLTIYVALRIEDVRTEAVAHVRGFFEGFREMFRVGTSLKRFVVLQALGSITWGMSMPFPFVYAAEFKGADPLLIGYMGTCAAISSMALALPMGTLADRKGRKFAIYLTRPFFWGSFLLLVLASKGMSWLLLLAWLMRGVMMSSSAWTAMSMEMVPQEYRGRWTGFNSLFQSLLRVPAMLIGGYLYESVNPVLVFLIPILVDSLVRVPILVTIPETLRRSSSE